MRDLGRPAVTLIGQLRNSERERLEVGPDAKWAGVYRLEADVADQLRGDDLRGLSLRQYKARFSKERICNFSRLRRCARRRRLAGLSGPSRQLSLDW